MLQPFSRTLRHHSACSLTGPYDADHLRHRLEQQGTAVVTRPRAAVAGPTTHSTTTHIVDGNVIERMFCRLNDWRCIATRYDRLARNFLSALALAAPLLSG
ncbi:transposase [Roseomonas hellenica]|uniref:Transposase n=1 Tax=Plastoroseomonas hellenica TaxID=2687306 RepID=A0ABS5F1Y9_9PROT|nr:transposase [Plastoroseomonas hellenica]